MKRGNWKKLGLACGMLVLTLMGKAQENPETDSLTVMEPDTCVMETAGEVKPAYDFWKQRKYLRLGFVTQDSKNRSGAELNSAFGFGLVRGKNYFLHKQPIAGMLKFAIDFGFGLQYVRYRDTSEDTSYGGPSGFLGDESQLGGDSEGEDDILSDLMSRDFGLNALDISLHVGPAVVVNPVKDLRLCAYWHFCPAGTLTLKNMTAEVGFVPYMNYGLEATWRKIGIGVERQYGIGKYWNLINLVDGGNASPVDYLNTGFSFYVSLRL